MVVTVKSAKLCKRYILSVSMVVGCWVMPGKVHAFDYKTYSKEVRQIRTLMPPESGEKPVVKGEKKSRSKAFKTVVNKLLEALDSDLVPARIFQTGDAFSLYFKLARVTKFGIKYRF